MYSRSIRQSFPYETDSYNPEVGPGSYMQEAPISIKNGFAPFSSLAIQKVLEIEDSGTPSPNLYSPVKVRKHFKVTSFNRSRSERLKFVDAQVPGFCVK